MRSGRETPLGAILKGAVAGVVGTLAMDLLWYARYRRTGGEQGFVDWDLSAGVESYDEASPPAQVGKRVVESLFQVELEPTTAAPMANIVHFATGAGWGTSHGIIAGSMASPTVLTGLLTGTTAWLTSYGVLAPAGLYKPMWEYDAKTLWEDLSAHLLYGLATGVAYRLLRRRG